MSAFARYTVPSKLEQLLGIASVRKTADVDVYRDRDDRGPAPYRARIDGQLMRTKAGTVRKFPSMAGAIKATEEAAA
jgi:hypothetical protein